MGETLNVTENVNYKVKDMNLSDFGRKEIDVAEHEMPGLMSIRKKYSTEKPLAGVEFFLGLVQVLVFLTGEFARRQGHLFAEDLGHGLLDQFF